LQATSLGGLLDAIVEGLRRLQLDAVTLVIRDVRHEIRQLLPRRIRTPSPPGPDVPEALEGLAPQYNNLWQPWLGPFVGADHSLIFPGRDDLGSCALLPLRRNGELIGCLNFGSRDPKRFTRHHAVDFLQPPGRHRRGVPGERGQPQPPGAQRHHGRLTGLYNRRYLQHRLGRRAGPRAPGPAGRWPA
jgi:two-component system, cell cycle response regulator